MATILEMIDRVQNLQPYEVAKESIAETKEAIADLNAEQMNKGLRNDGSEILPAYNVLTLQIKKLKGQPTDRVTLKDTGAFYAGITADVRGEVVEILSTDPKSEHLEKKYSKRAGSNKGSIFGLSGPFKVEYIDGYLQPAYLTNIRNALKL